MRLPPSAKIIDLATLTEAYTAQDGDILTGTLAKEVKISVADGASITLEYVSINAEGTVYEEQKFSGITCLGDATITLSGINVICGFHNFYPAIFVPEDHTLTIQGDGALDVSGSGTITRMCAALGSVRAGEKCGNLVFQGGVITAEGGDNSAAIGASYASDCGDITICGTADITVVGYKGEAGIGSGSGPAPDFSTCGDITIWGMAKVHAIGSPAIGAASLGNCGNITITAVAEVIANGVDCAPGIGSGNGYCSCKAITIRGGHIRATCDDYGPGIGTSFATKSTCESITIGGGSIIATGGEDGPAIGSGPENTTGIPIVITSGITSLTANRGSAFADFIGAGRDGTRGSVTIDGVENATPESTFPNLESFVDGNSWWISGQTID